MGSSEIATALDLGIIRYSRVWEDWKVLYEGLQVAEDDVILCITSAGDNILNLLLQRPKRIVSIDMSPAQNALLELKRGAIRQLNHEQFLELIGIKPSSRRVHLYKTLYLPQYSKDFWDENIHLLETGIANCGKFDKSIICYLEEHLPSCLTYEQIDSFLNSKNPQEQLENFNSFPLGNLKKLQTWYYGKMMKNTGRDIKQYKYVKKNAEEMGDVLWSRFVRVCTNTETRDNVYLDLFLRSSRSTYEDICDKLPPYLKKENYETLKELVGRVEIVTDTVENFLQTCESQVINKVALSDIFEYMSEDASNRVFDLLASKCCRGGRLAWWNLFVPRLPPSCLGGSLKRLNKLSNSLSQTDRVFFWEDFNVYEII